MLLVVVFPASIMPRGPHTIVGDDGTTELTVLVTIP